MPDYKNGLIYTIRSPHTEKIYIGSTIQPLYKRFFEHRYRYKKYLKDNNYCTTSHKILEFGDAYIELLESCPCNSKMELLKREGEMIRQYKDVCVNICVAGRTDKQYYQDNKQRKKEYYQGNKEKLKQYYQENKEKLKERKKQYYQENKEKLKEREKQYYQENKEKLKERQKQYRMENKEQIKERKKQYYQENKEKLKERQKQYRMENKEQYQDNKQRLNERKKEKHDCECGGHYTLDHKARHKKTKIHLFIVNKLLI